MQVIRGLSAAPNPASAPAAAPCALTIGNFDGVHRGHQALLAQVVEHARRFKLSPAVMTFEPHPREFFTPAAAPARIGNLRDQIEALAAYGIERVFVIHFDRRFAALSPAEFAQRVVAEHCQARWLIVGGDFRFGARRAGDVALLRQLLAPQGIVVAEASTVFEGDERVSSSLVRTALQAGDLAQAHDLLGRPFTISGRVGHGAKLGRTIGFPTLNLRMARRRPAAQGIFAVRVHGLGAAPLAGVASLGQRPTVDDSGRWLLEVHVFDFSAEVYGRRVTVEFVQRLRDEARYDNLADLTRAIEADARQARAILAAPPQAAPAGPQTSPDSHNP